MKLEIKFVGNGDSDPASVTLYGHDFPLNKFKTIEVDDAAAAKLAGNSHFELGKTRQAEDDQDDA